MNRLLFLVLALGMSAVAPLHHSAQTTKQESTVQTQTGTQATEKIYSMDEVDKQADVKNIDGVLKKVETRMQCTGAGTTTLSVVLRKTGKVSDAKIETTTGCKVSAKAIAELRKIKFTPALKNGKPVSQLYEIDTKMELHAMPIQDGAPNP